MGAGAEPVTRSRIAGSHWWAKLPGGGFARSVVTVASGTAVAQLLLALAMPVLTRLYTPADYGSPRFGLHAHGAVSCRRSATSWPFRCLTTSPAAAPWF
jgi:hypothetical protein